MTSADVGSTSRQVFGLLLSSREHNRTTARCSLFFLFELGFCKYRLREHGLALPAFFTAQQARCIARKTLPNAAHGRKQGRENAERAKNNSTPNDGIQNQSHRPTRKTKHTNFTCPLWRAVRAWHYSQDHLGENNAQ